MDGRLIGIYFLGYSTFMTSSILPDAFAHHVWATLRLIDVCADLSPAQLATPVPGTYGSIIDTLRHLVGADSSYLFVTAGRPSPDPGADDMDIAQLRAEMESHGAAWADVVAGDIDADAVLVRTRDDGSESHAPLSIRLAQALHHGSDHRSQICTALTVLDVTPPDIDVWDFGFQDGRVFERPAAT
jgi:uncharacterized damage-inducible protein DinB